MPDEDRNNCFLGEDINDTGCNCGCGGNNNTILFFLIIFLLLFTDFGARG